MAEQRRLDIIIGARDRAKKVLSKVRKRFGKFAKRVGAVVAAGLTLATTAIAKFVSAQRQAVDEIAKMAAQLGLTTQELIGLQKASEITGAGAGLLNQSLGAMTKRLGEAQLGFGRAQKGLDLLGIGMEQISALGTAEQFRLIAERVRGLDKAQEKAVATSALFSRAGLKLVNTLNLGRDGLDQMAKRARDLGISLSTVDARRVENMNDSIADAKDAFTGLFRQLTVQLAPSIKKVADDFVAWATSGAGASQKVKEALGPVLDAITVAITLVNGARVAIANVQVVVFGLIEVFFRLMGAIRDVMRFALVPLGNLLGKDVKRLPLIDATIDGFADLRREAFKTSGEIQKDFFTGKGFSARSFFDDAKRESDNRVLGGGDDSGRADPAAAAARLEVEKLIDKRREELELIGLTDKQIQIRTLREKGATEAQIDRALAIRDEIALREQTIEKQERQKELEQDRAQAVRETLEKRREELRQIGKTSEQLEIKKLKEQGATDAQIEQARRLQEQINQREKEVDLIQKGVDLARERATEESRAKDQVRALNAALEAGKITQEQFKTSMSRITQEFAEQNRQQSQIQQNLVRASGATVRFLTGFAGGRSESSRRAQTLRFQQQQTNDISGIRSMFREFLREIRQNGGDDTVKIGGLIS